MARRNRPKKYSHGSSDHLKMRRRWRRWLPSMRRDMTHLLGSREIFWGLQEVAKENSEILSPGDFFDWMCRNYISAISIGIRSFVDQDRRSHSLWRMLYEILERPGVIDCESHARMYRSTSTGIEFGRHCFQNVVGKGAVLLSQGSVRSDLKILEDASERVRRYVNKRVAHRTSPGGIRRLPKFNEVDAALDVLDKILSKYDFLLTASGIESFRATRQHDWRQVLWEPWIPEGTKLHPDT